MLISEIQKGDKFSELNYYSVSKVEGDSIIFNDKAGNPVRLSNQYIEQCLVPADQYEKEEKVNKTTIREIFANIGSQVFTVQFVKQDKPMTKTAYKKARAERLARFADTLELARAGKKGIAKAAIAEFEDLLDSPLTPIVRGEKRVLRGYKKYGDIPVDGKYKVIDMDLEGSNNERQVNINTIEVLVVDNIKYTLK